MPSSCATVKCFTLANHDRRKTSWSDALTKKTRRWPQLHHQQLRVIKRSEVDHGAGRPDVVFTLSKPNTAALDNFTIGILPHSGQNIQHGPRQPAPIFRTSLKVRGMGTCWHDHSGKEQGLLRQGAGIDGIVYKTVAVKASEPSCSQSRQADLWAAK